MILSEFFRESFHCIVFRAIIPRSVKKRPQKQNMHPLFLSIIIIFVNIFIWCIEEFSVSLQYVFIYILTCISKQWPNCMSSPYITWNNNWIVYECKSMTCRAIFYSFMEYLMKWNETTLYEMFSLFKLSPLLLGKAGL